MFSYQEIKQYAYLMRLHKPIGILLLLWPALWALLLAGAGKVDSLVFIVFVAGVVLMRSAGCVINDFADRNIDGRVKRTRDRPLAAGKVTTTDALLLFSILIMTAFLLVFLLNPFTIFLALVGAALTIFYPFMKRFTHLPQVGLGMAFAWSVPMAFAAETDSLPITAWLLFVAVVVWTVIYDTMYAMTDRDDDIKIGVKSTAIFFGDADRWIIGLLQALFLALLIGVGMVFKLKVFYYFSLLIAAGLFGYQQMLIRKREPERCFQAFLNNQWVGAVIFVGIALSYHA